MPRNTPRSRPHNPSPAMDELVRDMAEASEASIRAFADSSVALTTTLEQMQRWVRTASARMSPAPTAPEGPGLADEDDLVELVEAPSPALHIAPGRHQDPWLQANRLCAPYSFLESLARQPQYDPYEEPDQDVRDDDHDDYDEDENEVLNPTRNSPIAVRGPGIASAESQHLYPTYTTSNTLWSNPWGREISLGDDLVF